MRILVTGADGFLGSHLVDALLHWDSAESVVALVHKPPVRWLPRVQTDRLHVMVQDIIRLKSLDAIGEVDLIFHLAAVASSVACERNPETARLTNFQGTVNLLNLCLKMGRRPIFVYVSTAALYGEAEYLPIDEDHPVVPRDTYTSSKLTAEITVTAYNRQQGLPAVIVRPFNIYGPRQSEWFVLPTIINQCFQGYEVRLGDGRLIRNFTYVTDAVDLIIRAGITHAANGAVINLGSRESISIADLARKVVDHTGCGLEPVAENLLGWRQRVGLDQGLSYTIEYYRLEAEKRRQLASHAMDGRY